MRSGARCEFQSSPNRFCLRGLINNYRRKAGNLAVISRPYRRLKKLLNRTTSGLKITLSEANGWKQQVAKSGCHDSGAIYGFSEKLREPDISENFGGDSKRRFSSEIY